MKITIRKKILSVVLFLNLIIIIATSGVYYYLLRRDIRELSDRQIRIVFEMIFDDLVSRTKDYLPRIETFIGDSLAGNIRIVYATQKRFSPSGEGKDLQRWRHIQELLSRFNRVTTAIGEFAPFLGVNEFIVYGKDREIMAVYRHIPDQEVLGVYLDYLRGGTFISLRTLDEKYQSFQGIQDKPKIPIPTGIKGMYEGVVPASTIATMRRLAGLSTIKFVSPIKHNGALLGVCVIHLGLVQRDAGRYSRFSQTNVNIFAGQRLSVGTLPEYKTISPDKSELFHAIDLLNLKEVPLLTFQISR